MKNVRFAVPVLLPLIIIGCALSCKKKNGASPSNSKIAFVDLIQSQSITHYRIVYNSQNNVDSIISIGGGTDTGHNGFEAFTYYIASYSIADENGNSYSVANNVDGMMTEVFQPDTLIFTYDSYNSNRVSEVDSKTASVIYPYYATTATTYQWANGDIVTITSPNGTDSIYYNTGIGGQQGDALRIYEFLTYGQSYTKTTHLPKEMTFNGSWLQKYFYQFDNDGRITQLMQVTTPNDTIIYNYRY